MKTNENPVGILSPFSALAVERNLNESQPGS